MNEKRTVKQEIESLYAETLALQTILVKVLGRLRAVDPALAAANAAGLDDAADHVEHIAIRLGEAASPEHTVKALRIVEELRTAILGDQHKPRGGI
jgi:hypothetical protein